VEELYLFLKGIIDPLFIVFALSAVAFFFCLLGRNKSGALILLLALILLYGLSIHPTANYLAYRLEKDYLEKSPSSGRKIDAIIVLGGGSHDILSARGTYPTEATAARVLAAVRYYSRSDAKQFICAGRGEGKISEAELMSVLAQELGIPKDKILLEVKSANTWEHAVEVDKMIPNKSTVLGVVTSAYHLRRSEREFKKYFRNVVALPAGFSFSSAEKGPVQYLPQARSLHMTAVALHEIIGRWWYVMKS